MTTKTDDIKLPPLPVGFFKHHIAGFDGPVYAEMQMEAYARAAVEADRQDRACDTTKMMPSDEEIDKLSHGFALQYQDHVRGFARALLSRYGSSSQPVEGQEVSIDISTGDHDAGRRAFGKLTGEVNPSAHGDVWLAEGYINEPAEDRSLGIATLKDVDAMIHILEKGKWGAEHVGKTPMSRRLEAAITKRLHGQPTASAQPTRCEDCPPVGYPTDKTRCAPCDRRAAPVAQEPVAYLACDPETGEPVWGEDCVCKDNVYSPEDTGTIGRPVVFAPVAVQPVVTDEMVTRFLGWHLPQDFAPGAGISFKPSPDPLCWPVGTDLLNDPQARAMLEYVLTGVKK